MKTLIALCLSVKEKDFLIYSVGWKHFVLFFFSFKNLLAVSGMCKKMFSCFRTGDNYKFIIFFFSYLCNFLVVKVETR